MKKRLVKSNLSIALNLLTVFFVVFGLALAGVGSSYAEKVRGVTKDTVSLGQIEDITGIGAYLGKFHAQAMRLLFKDINNQGGINGRKIKLQVQDNGYNPTKSVAAAKYMLTKYKIFAILDVFGSTPALATFPLIASEKIPTFIISNQSRDNFEPFKKYVFTVITPASDQAVIAVDYIVNDLGKKNVKLGIFHQDDSYGNDAAKGWKKAAEKYGLKVVGDEAYKRGTIDFSSNVVRMMRRNPDYVFLSGISPTAQILKESRKMGWSPQFLGDLGTSSPKLIQLVGDLAEGYIAFGDKARWHEKKVPGIAKMREVCGKNEPKLLNEKLDWCFINSWVTGLLALEGIKKCGRELTAEKFVEALENLKNFKTDGICAPISFSSEMHNGGGYAKVFKANVEKGIFLPISQFRKPSMK